MPQPDQRQADTARTSHSSLSTNPNSPMSSSDGVVRGAAPHINGSCQQQPPQQQDASVGSSSWNDYPSSDQSIKNSNTGNGDDHCTHWTATTATATTTTTSPSTKQFTCLYTKHKTQKRKIWQDGRLVVQSTRALLYDAHPPPGASNEPLDECDLTMIQSQSIRNSNETSVCMEKFLIQIEGVWKQGEEISSSSISIRNDYHSVNNGSNNTIHFNKSLSIRQSKGMQKVMSRKFRKPGKYIPPHPRERKRRTESENKNHLFGKRRKAPLQPGELERKYYGELNNDNDWNGNHEGRAGEGGWNHHHPRSHHDGYVRPHYDTCDPPETQRRHYNKPSSSSDGCVDAKWCRLDNMQESRLHHQESSILSAGGDCGQGDRGNMSRSSSSKSHEMNNSNGCGTNNANNPSSFILSHPFQNGKDTEIGINGMAPTMKEKEKTRIFAKNEFDPSTYYGEEDDDDDNDDGGGSATEDEKKWDEGPNGQFTHAGQGNWITMKNGPLVSRIDRNNVSDKNIHNERRTLTKRVRFDDDDDNDTNAFQVNEKHREQFRDAGDASEGRVGPANSYRKENFSLCTATYHRDQNKEEGSINHTNIANCSSFEGHDNNSNNNVLSKMELLALFSAGPSPSSVATKPKPSKFVSNHQSNAEMEVMPPKSNDNNDRRHDEVGICDHRKDDGCVPSNKENEHPVMFLLSNKHTDGSHCRTENNPFLQGLLRKEKEVDERISSTSMTSSSAFGALDSSQQPSGCDEDEYDDDYADDNDLWHEKGDEGADDNDALDNEDEKETNPDNDDRDEKFQFILPSASESSSCDDEDDKEDNNNYESAEQ